MTTGGGFIAGSIVGKLLLDKTGWNQSISAVEKDATKLGSAAKNLGAKFDEIGQKMQGIGIKVAAVGGVIVASFGGMIKKTADYGDAMHDLSQRTGVAVPILTSLSLAAQKSGTSMDGLARGFRLLANQMQAANVGNKTAAALFDSLGIKVANADGTLRDMNDVMLDVAGRFSGMEDGAQKAALAQDLFGRSGMELIPLLNLGAEGLKKEQEEAAKLGLVLSKDAADAADKFNDNLKSLGGAVQGVGIQIGTMLMPAVQSLVIHLTNIIAKVREWTAAHPGLVTMLGKVALALGILAAAIGPILIALPALIRGLQTLRTIAANPIILVITTSIPILTKAVADFTHELKNMNSVMQESGRSGFVSFLEGINSAWRRVALGMKDSNIVLSEANSLALLYAREGGRGTKDVLLEEVVAADKFTPALQAVKQATVEVTETLTPLAKGATFVRDVMQGFAGELTMTFTPAIRDMSLVMAAAPGTFNEVGGAAEGLEYVFKAIGDAIGASAATVKVAMWNMAADVLAAYGIIIAKLPELATVANTVTTQTKNYFDGLFNDIAAGFGNTIQSWLSGAKTFKDFMLGLWGNIKDAFFRMIGEMVAEWLINFAKKIIDSTVDIAASIAKNVGGAVSSLAKTAGSVASGFLSALGSVGSIISGIVSLIQLLRGPQKQTDVTYWLKLQWELLQNSYNFYIGKLTWMLESIPTAVRNSESIKTTLWKISTATQFSKNYLQTIASKSYLTTVVSYLKKIADTIGKLTGAAAAGATHVTTTGGYSGQNVSVGSAQLVYVAMPQVVASSRNQGSSTNITFHVNAIDRAGVETFLRRDAKPILQRMLARNDLRVPASAVGGP